MADDFQTQAEHRRQCNAEQHQGHDGLERARPEWQRLYSVNRTAVTADQSEIVKSLVNQCERPHSYPQSNRTGGTGFVAHEGIRFVAAEVFNETGASQSQSNRDPVGCCTRENGSASKPGNTIDSRHRLCTLVEPCRTDQSGSQRYADCQPLTTGASSAADGT